MSLARLRMLLLAKPRDFVLQKGRETRWAAAVQETLRDPHAIREPPRDPLTAVFIPRLEFTNRTITDDRHGFSDYGLVHIANEPSDGVLLTEPGHAGGITLADCLAICLWSDERLAVLHGGQRCLVRTDESIVTRAMREHALSPAETRVWIGAGVGACCYGLDTVSERAPRTAVEKPRRGPRREKPYSVNLRTIAIQQLQELGVPANNMIVDQRCTSCFTERGEFPFWSHVRGDAERNIFVAWLEQ